MSSVAVGGPGLVAVGVDYGTLTAGVWTSSDGSSWERIPHDDAQLGTEMHAVTSGGPGLVAVGSGVNRQAAAVWTSSDGSSWERVPHDEAVFGAGAMYAVTAGGPGLVAVGSDVNRQAAAVWTSTDGSSWERVPHDDEVFGSDARLGSGARYEMSSVAAGGPGVFAVGPASTGGTLTEVAGVWTSSDGLVWDRVATDDQQAFPREDRPLLGAVTSRGPGLVAVGRIDDERDFVAAVWTSPDGASWEPVPNDGAVFGGPVEPMSVTVWGPGIVMVGIDWDRDSAAVWTSP